MVSVSVFSENNVSIETTEYNILTKGDMIRFLRDLIDKIKYSGEHITLEDADIDTEKGLVNYKTISDW